MKNIRLTFLQLFILVLMYGCGSYRINLVEGSDPFHPTFQLASGSNPMPVASIGVVDSETNEIMWDVAKVSTISEVTYGVVPEGMALGIEAKPLKKDRLYAIICSYGDYGAIMQFMIVEKDKKLIVTEVGK